MSQKQIIFRADPELVDRISAAAEERGISRNHLIGRLLTEGLDDLIPSDELRFTRPKPVFAPFPQMPGLIRGTNQA